MVPADGLLAQAGGRLEVRRAQDVHHLLKVQRDVVVEETRRHHGCPAAGVTVKQAPVVESEVVGVGLVHKNTLLVYVHPFYTSAVQISVQ